eukprot:scaffold17564_cov46-Prasinocladus_malaysianus.AAC.1
MKSKEASVHQLIHRICRHLLEMAAAQLVLSEGTPGPMLGIFLPRICQYVWWVYICKIVHHQRAYPLWAYALLPARVAHKEQGMVAGPAVLCQRVLTSITVFAYHLIV